MLLASLEVTKKEVTRALVSLAADGQLANNNVNNTTPAVGLLAITNGSLAGGEQVGSVGSNGEAAVDVSCIVTSQFVTSQSLAIVFALSSAGESINNSSSKFLLSSSSSCDPKLCCSSSISVRRVIGRRSSHHLVVLQECDHLTV